MATDTKNVVQYGSRTFGEIRTDLIALIRQMYPEVLSDFTDSSVGAMLIDLNAGVSNNLAVNTDRAFQETQLEYAQQRANILNIAKNMGFNIPARRPSVTVVDFSITVPVLGNKPDTNYYPVLDSGAQVIGGGKTFETQSNIDWNSPVSSLGDPNRSIIPNLNNNGIPETYAVIKREVVINGGTSIFKKAITSENVIPFYSFTLPDPDVIEIESIILLEGTNFNTNPNIGDFNDSDNRYYEVDYLAQQRIFVDDDLSSSVNNSTNNIKAARWIDITKKFIKEYTPRGYCKLTFGSGDSDVNAFKEGFLKEGVSNRYFLENFLNNTALGEKLKANYTLFVKYRTGGGTTSNIGSSVLTQLGSYNLNVNGNLQNYNQEVRRSLTTTNPIPAIGGNDGLSTEQIRKLIKYNFSSQQRGVSLTDYLLQVYKMPGKYGSPYRTNAFKVNNKVLISILGIGSDGKLSNTSNSLLKENITEYLSQYRTINDYIEVKDGKIYNLGFEIDVYVTNTANNQIANNIISIVSSYFDINDHEMNEDVFLGKLQKEILGANGVLNIIGIKVFNKVGNQYSVNTVTQAITNTSTGEIKIQNNTIYSAQDSMFEIKYPEKDIKVLLRKKVS
ncbi:MAG: hypothetical protein PF487_10360 [Bacteroidales bacterium]|jgi:hypothetical protein|nr:hypothetical protein [Bacteroidales bacterium]